MLYKDVLIENSGDYYSTIGLLPAINCEIRLAIKEKTEKQYLDVLCYIVDYIRATSPEILDGQTMSYYSWILKFAKLGNHLLVNEATPNGSDYCDGADYSITVLEDQQLECQAQQVAPLFPNFGQYMMISDGVYEGLPVSAVRYTSPSHMTGWWLTTDEYNDDAKSLKRVHFFHVAFTRPDILKYLALPFGFRFYISKEETDVWFDDEVE